MRVTSNFFCVVAILIYSLNARGVIPIEVSVLKPGFVSIALLDTNGVLVRTLACAHPVAAGPKTILWDGTSDMGFPVSPGSYTTKGILFTNPPSLKYVMKVGTSGNPPWRTRDNLGDWGGDLGGPSGIAANSNSLIMLWSTVENETLSGIQQMDTNGNILQRYFSFYPYDGRRAVAMDGTNFYLGLSNPWDKTLEIAVYTLGEERGEILSILPTPPHQMLSGRFKGNWATSLGGMALTPNAIFVTAPLDDRLFIINRLSGAIEQQVSLPSPRGIAVNGDRLLLVSSNQVLRLRLDGTVESTIVADGILTSPNAMAVDALGNIYVGDSGGVPLDPEMEAGTKQIFVFSLEGSLLRTIGKPGGSPRSGLFDPTGFGQIRGMCLGPDGNLWVQDEVTGFQRTSRWSTNGTLQREWFQRKLVHYADLINPTRPNELVYAADAFDDNPALTAYRFDWTHATWRPAWSYALKYEDMFQEDVYVSHQQANPLHELQPDIRHPVFHYAPAELVTFTNGRNYFLNREGNGDGPIFTYSETEKPRPVALIGYHRIEIITNKVVSYYDGGPNTWFTWADANGDSRMATNEMAFTSDLAALEESSRVFAARLETNLNIRVLRARNGQLVEGILPLKEMLTNGVPLYDWALLQDLPVRIMPGLSGGAGGKPVDRIEEDFVPLHTTNGVYALLAPTTETPLDLPSIDDFWANRNWRKKLARFDEATGRCLWAVGRRAPDRAQPGEMYNPYGVSFFNNALLVADVLAVVWVWSSDGLYLGRLYNDVNPDKIWDGYAVHAEVLGPVTLFTDPATGKLYSVINDTGALIHEVILPDVQTLPSASIQVTAESLVDARLWDPDGPVPVPGALLKTELAGNTLLLSWHTNAAGFVLQSANNISGPWTSVTVTSTVQGDRIRVSQSIVGGRRFYQLRKP